MPQYYIKLLEEHRQIIEKINKISRFYDTDTYDALDRIQKSLLVTQQHSMTSYAHVLETRIEYEKKLLIERGYTA